MALCVSAAWPELAEDLGSRDWEPGNLLSNPSVEMGAPERGLVLDWTGAPEFPGPIYCWTEELAHRGRFSLTIDSTTAPEHANGGWQCPGFLIIPGVIYEFEGFANPNTEPGFTYVALAWFDKNHNWLGNTRNGSIARSTGEWVRVGVADVAPPRAAYARPYFRSDANGGPTFFDDASLRVIPGDTTVIPIANGDLELSEPGLWEGEGPGAVWVSDPQLAREGDACLGFLPAQVRSVWASPHFGTGTMGEAALNLRFFVDCSRAHTGQLTALLRWETAEGAAQQGVPTAVPLNGAGYREISLPLMPPGQAVYGQLIITATGLDGPVHLDDACLVLKTRTAPTRPAVAAAVARAYMAALPSPDRVEARFTQTFPEVQQRTQLAVDVADAIAQGITPSDETLQLFLLQCHYHAGDLDTCTEIASLLAKRFSLNDLRLDLTRHYIYYSSRTIAERDREKTIGGLDAQRAQAQTTAAKRELAKAYEQAKAPERAAELFDELSSVEDTDVARWAAFRAGICYSAAGRHDRAVERLRSFLEKNAWTRWAPEARLRLGESLYALQRYRECIELLKPALADEQWASQSVSEELIQWCYRRLAADASTQAEYCELFNVPGLPRLEYIGADHDTRGNWVGSYGRAAFVLCAMASPRDIVGGQLLPVRVAKEDTASRQATTVAWADSEQELPYSCYAGDPANPARLFLHVDQTDDPRALLNPVWGRRTFALWDDRGETHPFDDRGPDLYTRIAIPSDAWVLSLYFLDWDFDPKAPFHAVHEVTVTDLFDGRSVSFQVERFGDGVYHSIAILGPMDIQVRVRKGQSLCAALAGLFLDPIQVPAPLNQATENVNSNVRAVLDLCRSDPIRFAKTFQPLGPSAEASLAGAEATWALLGALPGRADQKRRAAQAWLAALTRERGKEQAVVTGTEAFAALVHHGDIGSAKALIEAILKLDSSPDALLDAARQLRVRDTDYAKRLLERYADALTQANQSAALRAEALRWFELAERDRQEGGNLRRTTFRPRRWAKRVCGRWPTRAATRTGLTGDGRRRPPSFDASCSDTRSPAEYRRPWSGLPTATSS